MTSRRGRKASQSSSSGSDDSGSDTQSDVLSLISSLSVARPKNETPEERKLRKQTLKALRRERRVEKKSCRVAFTEEKVRQEKEVANVQRRLKTIAMVWDMSLTVVLWSGVRSFYGSFYGIFL